MTDPASLKKELSKGFSVDITPAVEGVDPDTLSKLLTDKHFSVLVFDLRSPEEFNNGHITTSRNIPLDAVEVTVTAAVTEALKKKVSEDGAALLVVFASLLSPDLDDVAANNFVKHWDDATREEGECHPPAVKFVRILIGGVFYWLQKFRRERQLTSSFNEEYWEATLAKHD